MVPQGPQDSIETPEELRDALRAVLAAALGIPIEQLPVALESDSGKGRRGLVARISRLDAEALIARLVTEAAARQGVKVQDASLAWSTPGRGVLAVELKLRAKKGFFPAARIVVSGLLTIDEGLDAKLSQVAVHGEGVVGTMAAGRLREKLEPYDGRRLALTSLPLGRLRIAGVQMEAGEELKITARFA